ncbi:MAG: GGDEF domain-containing protein [bacterium]|nr:GGDEF domain-containing protein [bacterium]
MSERQPDVACDTGRDDDALLSALDGGMNPGLVRALSSLLQWTDLDGDALTGALGRLEQSYDDAVYAALLHLMTHLRFEPEQARSHWDRISEHRRTMEEALEQAVDLRVAVVSYFVQVDRQFHNPTIIEMGLFEKTRDSAFVDDLTGLRNFRFLSEFLGQELSRADHFNQPLSLIMIDVDDFKPYNDIMGHQAGNEALVVIARLLTGSLRKMDVAARFGGEEFTIILPGTGKADARTVAERIRHAIEQQPFPGEGHDGERTLTASLGIATYPADARDASELVRHADRAMYAAKSYGKNRVELYQQSSRSHRRVEALLHGHYYGLASDSRPLQTLKVSAGGVQFRSECEIPQGSLIDLRLEIPGEQKPVAVSGRTLSCEALDDGGFTVALRVLEIGRKDRRRLCDYLRALEDPAGAC